MPLPIRPSKIVMFERLRRVLRPLNTGIALDAASAHFKNRNKFRTPFYYGVDIDETALRDGVARHSDTGTFGILASIPHLDSLPSNSVDVVVSTNTLNYLVKEELPQGVGHLVRITKPGGTFVCDIPADDRLDVILPIIQQSFSSVQIFFIKNKLCRWYERLFETRDETRSLASHNIAGTLPFRLFAWLLGRTEYLTQHRRSPVKIACIVARHKITPGPAQSFDLSHIPVIHPRIYSIPFPNHV